MLLFLEYYIKLYILKILRQKIIKILVSSRARSLAMVLKKRSANYINRLRWYVGVAIVLFSSVVHSSQSSNPTLKLDPGGHMALISAITFTPDGRQLVSAGDDKVIRIWDVAQGRTIRTLRGETGLGDHGKIYAMALSPDGRWLAASGYMATFNGENKEDVAAIRLYDFASGEIVGRLKGHQNVVVALAFSSDGKHLVSTDQNGIAILWNVDQQSAIHTLEGHQAGIYSVAFTADGDLRLWQVADGALLHRLSGHEGPVLAVAASSQGGYIASGGSDQSIRLWDDRNGQLLKTLAKQPTEVGSLSFSPDGQFLLSGVGEGADRDCHVYRVMNGERVTTYSGHDNIVLATAIDLSGSFAATGGGNNQEIHLWSLQDGKLKHRFAGVGTNIRTVAFSTDGTHLTWEKTHLDDNRKGTALKYQMRLPDQDDPRLGVIKPLTSDASYIQTITTYGNWTLQTQSKEWDDDVLEIRHHNESLAAVQRTRKNGYKHISYTFTSDGKKIISSGSNGVLSVYDLQGHKLGDFVGHTSDVWAVAVSPDGRFLASASSDQTVRLWNVDNHELVLTLFHGNNDEWVAWTPSGFYAASPHGDRYVGWHQNRGADKAAEYYPASQFSAQRYRPELVVDTLLLRSEPEALAAWQKANPNDDSLDVSAATLIATAPRAPQILQGPQGEVQTSEQILEMEIDTHTQCLVVNVNGRRTRGLTRKKENTETTLASGEVSSLENMRCSPAKRGLARVKKEPTKEGQRRIIGSINLHPGSNRIEILARNAHGDSPVVNLEVTYRSQEVTYQSYKDIPPYLRPRLFVLSVGVSEYQDSALNLNFAHKDAEALAERLAKENGGLYKEVHVKVLTNNKADRINIIDALDFLKKMTQDDLAILFIAGHGKKDDIGEFYFLPHDVNHERLRSTGVKWEDFYEITTNLPGKVILLADACHSGDIFGQRNRRAVPDMYKLAREFSNADSGIIVLTSSQGQQFSEESPEWGHGAFTKAILEGLAGKADLLKDGVIKQSELETFVKDYVSNLTDGRQHPITIRPEALGDFPLAIVQEQEQQDHLSVAD
jgi:WD40 repeat protein